jgi:4-carboxymuconolactone decarboxylase
MTDNGRLEEGARVRRKVLGEAHVQRSLDGASDFTRPMQEFATEVCWGAVWSRPGLALRDRSLINLAMLAALGRSHELGVHVRGALRNGCSEEEIQEALLQAAAYAGVPAGLEAFRVAEAALGEFAREQDPQPDKRLGAVE